MYLVGDIGGTKTALAIMERVQGGWKVSQKQAYPSADYSDLSIILDEYLAGNHYQFDAACFGVAGPVRNGRCETMNLPWVVDRSDLPGHIHVEHVGIINDLEAIAWSLNDLPDGSLSLIHRGDRNEDRLRDLAGNRAVIAAGTGLGEAGLWYDGNRYHPFASEGGHASFSPQNEEEDALLEFLRKRFGHVSWERALSGPGIMNIYEFIVETQRAQPTSATIERMQQELPQAVITDLAMSKECPACELTIDFFVSLYGAEAGNLALSLMSTGGIFIGGGIAPRILPLMDTDLFRDSFIRKGRLRSVLESVPVWVIKDSEAPIYGAARYARNLIMKNK